MPDTDSADRTRLNLLGEVDSENGEGRRNENVQLTLIDNNVLKELNTRLGRYTNFVNLLDLTGVALPAGFRQDGLPLGVTLLGQAFTDRQLLRWGQRFTAAH